MKKWFLIILGAMVALVLLVVGGLWFASEPRPRGSEGQAADALAHSMQKAVNLQAWEQTGAVKWNFGGRHQLLWDRTRGLVDVRWEGQRVLRRTTPGGDAVVYVNNALISGDQAGTLADTAYALFCNDSFWLNPVAHLFDEGVTRQVLQRDGQDVLLVGYNSGGVTPGDAYLWRVGDDGLPTAWRMWVSIIPFGGMRASWAKWITLKTGARLSTFHDLGMNELVISDLAGAATLEQLVGGDDPFAPLSAGTEEPEPTSMPH